MTKPKDDAEAERAVEASVQEILDDAATARVAVEGRVDDAVGHLCGSAQDAQKATVT